MYGDIEKQIAAALADLPAHKPASGWPELDPMALTALRNNQRQLDADGIEVGVLRQALDMAIAFIDSLPTPPASVGSE